MVSSVFYFHLQMTRRLRKSKLSLIQSKLGYMLCNISFSIFYQQTKPFSYFHNVVHVLLNKRPKKAEIVFFGCKNGKLLMKNFKKQKFLWFSVAIKTVEQRFSSQLQSVICASKFWKWEKKTIEVGLLNWECSEYILVEDKCYQKLL